MTRLGPARPERVGGAHRVIADVDGSPAWYASADVDLRPAPEAFASAFTLPALETGSRLETGVALDRTWQRGAGRAVRVTGDWWGHEPLPPEAPPRRRGLRPRRRAVALAFSAGADSLFTLRRSQVRPDALVTVHGFDVALGDHSRFAAVERSVRRVGAELGLPVVVVSTNLREHPVFSAASWERVHGGGLAGAGHALGAAYGTLVISSTFARVAEEARPWGSHYRLDRHWSSSRVRIVHVGEETRRIDKVAALAGDPIAQRHLRICWEHLTGDLNCSRCDKCLITMAVLHAAGRLGSFATLDGPEVIAERLDALRHTSYTSSYGELLRRGLPADVAPAAARLLERTLATVGRTEA